MNRELIMTTLYQRLAAPPLVCSFTADTVAGDPTLYNVSDASGLMAGLPVFGAGIPAGTLIATTTPAVTLSLPATADGAAVAISQGCLSSSRRLLPAARISDTPALFLADGPVTYPPRPSSRPALITLRPSLWLYYTCPDPEDVNPAGVLNALIDAVERVLDPSPQSPAGVWQDLGLAGIVHCRIEGEVELYPGHFDGRGLAVVPLAVEAVQSQATRTL